ncbi:MAG TPA: biotin--[acetyl-CoA-carboxylase] ligase [Devosiaceae bacterium]|nr:biotin--[acetyl-CoA-carboxylase] ligase [Devosiaceae bacterium]
MRQLGLGQKAAARGYRLFGFDSIGSTSDAAAEAARAGDAGDTWFAALEQTAGRGRRGRPWETTRGNLAASLLYYPKADPAAAATLGFVAGVALGRALATAAPDAAIAVGLDGGTAARGRFALKWPNDVLADGAKLAGILLEAHRVASGRTAVVVGFGINIAAAPQDLPYPATSLRQLGSDATAAAVFAALSDCWVDCIGTWDDGRGAGDILAAWRQTAAGIGAEIAVRRDGDVIRGIFETIDDSGRLIVRGPDNTRIPITAGDVHFGATAGVTQ